MGNYRVEYTEIKPGGHRDRQCVRIDGTRSDVVYYLSREAGNVAPGSVEVFESFASDSVPKSIGSLGW